MLRNMVLTLQILAALVLISPSAMSQQGASEKPLYVELKPALPTQTGDKIEVVEVFWYGCPHCYSFEPFLENWEKTLPADVQLIRVPGVLSQNWIPLGKAYYTAEKLGVLDKTHRPLFDAIHKDRKISQVPDEESLKEFFVSKGVAADQFSQTFASKEVEAKIRQAYFLARDYKLTGVPSLVINGKYLTSTTQTGSFEAMISVLNQLIEKERQARK